VAGRKVSAVHLIFGCSAALRFGLAAVIDNQQRVTGNVADLFAQRDAIVVTQLDAPTHRDYTPLCKEGQRGEPFRERGKVCARGGVERVHIERPQRFVRQRRFHNAAHDFIG